MGSIVWDREIAEIYDETYAAQFDLSVLETMLDLLSALAQGGPALEFAVGTGRVALALSERNIEVQGIEISPPMVEQLQANPGADAVNVTIGDMTTTRVPGAFQLVRRSAPYRYVPPSSTDLMARLAGLHRRHRWAGWGKEPFTSESTSQVAVYRRNRDSAP
jgi:16S rRNA A1518/A1519 N6-dimethyltransferase RsmA/KsgA/DIM1 with predicted DNA glycosylase/AP lyase activity